MIVAKMTKADNMMGDDASLELFPPVAAVLAVVVVGLPLAAPVEEVPVAAVAPVDDDEAPVVTAAVVRTLVLATRPHTLSSPAKISYPAALQLSRPTGMIEAGAPEQSCNS